MDASGNLYIAEQANNRIRKISASGIISTVAGNGSFGFSGDDGVATSASLYYPTHVAVDASGNLYIADQGNNRIRKVSPSGIISTVAGNGSAGFSGDGGLATAASLYRPQGVAVDALGNLYIADISNQRIRKVNTSGIISTVAGIGSFGFSGDGGSATAASLHNPSGVAVDASGNLYIADYSNYRIRKVNTSGIISTVAGNSSYGFSGDGGSATAARLNNPIGVAVDASGNLYIADENNNRIRKVSPSGIISTVAGNGISGFSGDGGAATAASLNYPRGVVVDGSGNLYIADKDNYRIRKVSGLTNGSLAITGVSGLSCTTGNANRHTISFTPQYSGGTGAPISFSVVNEMLPTNSPGPYSLQLYTDNPSITLKASQTGASGEASFVYNWLSACSSPPVPPPLFSIADVTGVSCTSLSATLRRLHFTPTYSGTTGAPISFSVVNEMLPTTSPGPYTMMLHTDNPIIDMRAVQSGSSASHAYNWLAACQNPAAPLTITGVNGASCTALSATLRQVSFSPVYGGGTGTPISFSVVNEMLPTNSSGPYTMTLYTDNPIIDMRATQAGGTASHAYNWLAACQNPTAPLTITGVNGASCTALSATLRRVSFSPVYGGGTGAPISFSVVNEMLPTNSPGPYTLTLYTDNPVINLRATQAGSTASHAYNWLATCSASPRIGAIESVPLRVTVLSNPTVADEVSVEISGAVGALTLSVFDSRGHRVSEKSPGQPVVGPVRTTVRLGQLVGVYLLRVQTPTQSQVVKVVRE